MTREALIEVMAAAMRLGYAKSGSHYWDAVPDRIKGAYLKDATNALSALEAAEVRLVPSETNEAMSDAFYHALNHGYPDHRKDRQSKNQGWTMQSEFIWQAMLAASPYAPQKEQTHESD